LVLKLLVTEREFASSESTVKISFWMILSSVDSMPRRVMAGCEQKATLSREDDLRLEGSDCRELVDLEDGRPWEYFKTRKRLQVDRTDSACAADGQISF
jgi:hypothetical protein